MTREVLLLPGFTRAPDQGPGRAFFGAGDNGRTCPEMAIAETDRRLNITQGVIPPGETAETASAHPQRGRCMPRQMKNPTKAEQRARSMKEILDAAEYLFAQSGFHGVSIRDVADRVGLHSSLLHYYFDDKRTLFEAVFKRRADATNKRRMTALKKYEAQAGDHPTVEGALRAFLDTDFDLYMEGGEAWMNYAGFMAHISNSREGAEMMKMAFDPAVFKLLGILKRALPDYPEEDIYWGFQFVTGALVTSIARTGRIDYLSGGLCRSDDFPAIKKRIATFLAGGFLAMKNNNDKVNAADQSNTEEKARPPKPRGSR